MLEQFVHSQAVPQILLSTPLKPAESASITFVHIVHKTHLRYQHPKENGKEPNIPRGGTIIDIKPVKGRLTYAIIPNPAIPLTIARNPSLTFCVILLAAIVVSLESREINSP